MTAIYMPRTQVSEETNPANIWISNLQPPELLRLSVEQANRPVVLCNESPRRPIQILVYLYQHIQEDLLTKS